LTISWIPHGKQKVCSEQRMLVRPLFTASGCVLRVCATCCELGSPPPVKGPVEADPEYKLIVDANNLVVEVDNESSECLRGGGVLGCHMTVT